MEKLNEYLQTLLSTCSYELHLEPNKTPYMVTKNGKSDIANSPLLGTQISTIIFPLIPPDVKQQLPNQAEIEFVHNHNLGNFSFNVKKSPSGFNVTIRPMLSDLVNENAPEEQNSPEPQLAAPAPKPNSVKINADITKKLLGDSGKLNKTPLEDIKSRYTFETDEEDILIADQFDTIELENNDTLQAYVSEVNAKEEEEDTVYEIEDFESLPTVETVSAFDPEFATTFSDEADYEPPIRPQEFATELQPPVQKQTPINFAPQDQNKMPLQQVQNPQSTKQNFEAPQSNSMQVEEEGFVPAPANPQIKSRMDALFHKMADIGASDLHMSVSMPPMIRLDGKMQKLESGERVFTADTMRQFLTSIMPDKNQEEFARRNDTDFAYEIENLARFRANIFMDRKGMGGVFRIIPTKILTAEQLGLSEAIMDLCRLSKGLVVVTGPTGSGKSTTLCAMVDSINKNREDHIITIEDPIEFTHENQKCLVNQREVHNHTASFKDALRAALREDPDILLVGEMRDLETISIAIETAETGHLVFGTLHTTTAVSTIDRIIDQFPADRQEQIRVMLSESLRGVIAQTLLPKIGGGRVAALEVLIVTPAVSNLIREGKSFQIPSAMQTGKSKGMVMLNDALFELVKKGLVEPRDAYIKAVDKPGLEALLTRGGFRI